VSDGRIKVRGGRSVELTRGGFVVVVTPNPAAVAALRWTAWTRAQGEAPGIARAPRRRRKHAGEKRGVAAATDSF
jgi:hypothetical protein